MCVPRYIRVVVVVAQKPGEAFERVLNFSEGKKNCLKTFL